MKVLFERGRNSGIYIIEDNNIFYLVNLKLKTLTKAKPENTPDMFLEFGYFYDVENVSDEEYKIINEICDKKKW